MRSRFAIAALGYTEQGIKLGRSDRDLRGDAVERALQAAGLERDAIDGYIHCWGEREDLRYLGLSPNFNWALSCGGATPTASILAAIGMIEAGQAELVACVYGIAPTSGYIPGNSNLKSIGSHSYGYPSLYGMMGAASAHALHARRHMHLWGTTSEQLGAVAVQQRAYASVRPGTTGFGKPITLEDHQNSPMIVDPFHRLDCCRDTDGGVAVLVCRAERARQLTDKPIYILGAGTGQNIVNWHKGVPYENHDNIAPAKARAFAQACITLADIDMAQLYDPFTISVIMQLEAHGFMPEGQGGPFVAAGGMAPDGPIPTNTGGGQLSGFYATGFTAIIEAILQLRGEAGAGQLAKADIALCSGHGLNAGVQNTWNHATLLLGNQP